MKPFAAILGPFYLSKSANRRHPLSYHLPIRVEASSLLCQPAPGCAQYITLLTLLHLSPRITSIKDHITVIVTQCDLLTMF